LSIEQILSLPDHEYEEYVARLAMDEEGFWAIDELDDELLKVVKTQPEDVERLCRINSKVFEKLTTEASEFSLLQL